MTQEYQLDGLKSILCDETWFKHFLLKMFANIIAISKAHGSVKVSIEYEEQDFELLRDDKEQIMEN